MKTKILLILFFLTACEAKSNWPDFSYPVIHSPEDKFKVGIP